MGIKIYTYKDPFYIDKYSYWEEIKKYPHFCVSNTLEQGLEFKYGKEIKDIFCINDVLDMMYSEWRKNPNVKVNQYLKLSEKIKIINKEKIRRSFKFNQNDVLSSVRMLKELDVNLSTDIFNLNEEQRYLIGISKELHKEEYFNKLNKINNKEELIDGLKKIKNDKDKSVNNKCQLNLDKIVIHGIHRFNSMLFYFIKNMKEIDVDIIFLINYNEKYKNIYDTWKKVYNWTNKEFITEDIKISEEETYGDIGEIIGCVLEGNFNGMDDYNFASYKINVFENLTSFSEKVSKDYDESCKRYGNSQSAEKGKKLYGMRRQYYAANNKKINEILKVYYPEQFGEKHFLAYPIGQFILGLYNMWDIEKETLVINDKDIRECFSVGFWENNKKSSILEIYDKTKYYFNDKQNISEVINRLENLKYNIKKLNKDDRSKYFRKLSFYTLSEDEVDILINRFTSIKKISESIFIDEEIKNKKNKKISYSKHYKKLLEIINSNIDDYSVVSEKERKFIHEIQNKLNNIDDDSITGDIDDINQVINLYLNSSNKEEENISKWIVRNLEQLDGGVLLSEGKNLKSEYYHLCLISDKMMNPELSELLPWPLSIEMLKEIDSNNKYIDAIITSKIEYKNLLRYLLFYGTMFCKKDIEISFIKDCGDNEEHNLYFLLDMLPFKKENYNLSSTVKEHKKEKKERHDDICNIKINKTEELKASICKYRYLLDEIIEENKYYKDEWQIIEYAKILLIIFTIHKMEKYPIQSLTDKIIESNLQRESDYLCRYLDFLTISQIKDMNNKAKVEINKIKNSTKGNYIGFINNYVDKKIEFLAVKLQDFKREIDIYNFSDENKIRVSKKEIDEYMRKADVIENNVNTEICKYCPQKYLCVNYFEEE